MGLLESEQQLCPCYKECEEFLKLVELKDTGLVVYCHSTRTEDVRQGEVVESAVNTSRDVFILQNTRDVKITPSDLTSELEKKDISCPRCRKIYEHAQELMQKVTSIDRRNIIGICDHCRKKAQSIKKPCFACEEIVKKFISVKGEQKEDTKKYIKIWLTRMGHLIKDSINLDKPKKLETRAYSDLQINQLCQKSPKSRREPEVQQMFCSETHKSYTDLYTEMSDANLKDSAVPEKSVAFTQPIEPADTNLDVISRDGEAIKYATIAGSLSVESDVTFVGTYVPAREPPKTSLKDRKQADMSDYYDESSMDAKEAIKKRHDLSLRHMMRTEKDSGVTYPASKRPEIYEIPKIAPWEHPKTTTKYHDDISEIYIKMPTKTKQDLSSQSTRDSDSVSHRRLKYGSSRTSQKDLKESQVKRYNLSEFGDDSIFEVKGARKRKYLSSRTSQKSLRDPYAEQYQIGKYDHGKIKKDKYDSEGKLKIVKREDFHLPDKELKLQRSVAKMRGKKDIGPKQTVENILKTQFSFFFPKGTEKGKNKVKLGARSSQLIKNTQEKLRLQAESEKKRLEEERQQKHLEQEKKKLAREERRQQAEEKKLLGVEDQKYYAVDTKISTDSRKYTERDLESKSVIAEEKYHHKFKREHSREGKFKSDKDGRELVSESELRSKLSKASGLVEKDLKHKTQPRDRMEKGKISRLEQDDEIDVVFEKSKSRPDQRDKSDGEFEKDFKTKREQKDKIDRELDKSKRDLKSKSEKRDTFDEVSEKAKKGLKSKSGLRDTSEEVLGKAKKDYKGDKIDDVSVTVKKDHKVKSEHKEKDDEVTEKGKKGLKERHEPTDKYDDEVPIKSKKGSKVKPESKGKLDEVADLGKKYPKEKRESKEKDVEITLKGNKDLMQKPGQQDTIDVVPEKGKKDLKSRTEQRGKILEGKKDFEKSDQKDKSIEKGKKTKTERKDWDKEMDKEMATALKEREKEEREEKLQRDKEEKERLKQVDQIRKEKEGHKKLSPKEVEEASKKASKDKDLLSKKKEKSLKGKVESPKKQESSEIEVSMSKIKIKESKELRETKQQDMGKEKKKKDDFLKEREESPKRPLEIKKEKGDSEKESKGKVSSKEDSPKSMKEPKEASSKKTKETADEAQLKKLQADLKKEKEEASKMQKQQESEAQKVKDMAEKRAKEEGERKLKSVEAKAVPKPEPKPRFTEELEEEIEEPTTKELLIRDIKVSNKSADDLVLRLVKLKQAGTGHIKINPCDFDPELLKAHRCHHKSGQLSTLCALCLDSELEIDVESYDNKINLKKEEITDIIIGENIFKYKPRREKSKETEVVPLLFKSEFIEESSPLPPIELVKVFPRENEPAKKPILAALLAKKDAKGIDPEPGKGIIRYALSDRTFIDKGWTMLPTEKVVRKMNVYRMRPAHPEFDWFEHNKNKRLMTYDTGERLAEFDDNGRGRWYYRSGRLALDYYDAEETNAQQRFVIYSSGEPDERGRTHPITILATFDYLGNGIVFDHAGKIRLKYNQTEGVVLDRGIGPVSHWKWHTLNDPPVLQQVMIDTQMAHKDPEIIKLGSAADSKVRPDNEEMLAIEFDNFIKEKSKKLSQKFKPFQIKMKAMKINEHFSLKVLDQATIYLIFRDGSTNLKLNIGMILDHQEIVDTDTAEVGEVSNNLERFPARTDSLAGLQRSVAYAQRYERQRTERERRLRRPEPCVSADHLTAAASPPLRPPLRTLPTGSTTSAGYCNCRKPTNNLYYNTRLL